MAQQKVKIEIDKRYGPLERKAIAQDVVDFIVDRTKKGLNKNNSKFHKYSKKYTKSLDFKIAGKSKSNVNLTLTGDMLTSLKHLTDRSGSITVGFDKDDENNGKAEGNIKGTYGQSSSVGYKRDFLGITKKDLKDKVLKKYPINETKGKGLQGTSKRTKARTIADDIDLGFNRIIDEDT